MLKKITRSCHFPGIGETRLHCQWPAFMYVAYNVLHLLHHELFPFGASVMSWGALRGARLLVSNIKYFYAMQPSEVLNYFLGLMVNIWTVFSTLKWLLNAVQVFPDSASSPRASRREETIYCVTDKDIQKNVMYDRRAGRNRETPIQVLQLFDLLKSKT